MSRRPLGTESADVPIVPVAEEVRLGTLTFVAEPVGSESPLPISLSTWSVIELPKLAREFLRFSPNVGRLKTAAA